MKEATLLYPHQLARTNAALACRTRPVVFFEEPLFFGERPAHAGRVLFHRLSMRAFFDELRKKGYAATYHKHTPSTKTDSVFRALGRSGVRVVHIADTTDHLLEKRIARACRAHGITRVWYHSPLFLLPLQEAQARYRKSGKRLASFYRALRKDKHLLLTKSGAPRGGKWSFDVHNRKPLPHDSTLPADIAPKETKQVRAARHALSQSLAHTFGQAQLWMPYTRRGALHFLSAFLKERFASFGPYEDAIDKEHTRLFHSSLSPLLNVGLVTPEEVIEKARAAAAARRVPLASTEGFIRQVLGWREFMRAAYECDGETMRTANVWKHERKLPASFWKGTTGLLPVDTAIARAHAYGYTHHIERLMVLGNLMFLLGVRPVEAYRWFMSFYVDAYDWVMVPNVYGMSLCADGGTITTKPYIAGGAYLRKMSNYPAVAGKGEPAWDEVYTALYWEFVRKHRARLLRFPRLSMMPRILKKMRPARRRELRAIAQAFMRRCW